MNPPSLIPNAEPFFHRGGPVGCLMLHGFTAAPEEIRNLGQHMADHGHTVYGPRLPFHGSHFDDMGRARWWDWWNAALDGYFVLKAQCEVVLPIGLSMGGLLSLLLASQMPVAGVVAMGVPLELEPNWRLRYIRQLAWFQKYYDGKPREDRSGPEWATRVAYEKFPVVAIAELLDLQTNVRAQLGNITAPVFLIHSGKDLVAPYRNMGLIASLLTATQPKTLTLDRGGHILTVDVEHRQVFAAVAQFVADVASRTK